MSYLKWSKRATQRAASREQSTSETTENRHSPRTPVELIKAAIRRAWSSRSLRSAFFAFEITRVLIFSIFILTLHFSTVEPQELRLRRLSLERVSVLRELRPVAGRGDAGWYILIADQGYDRLPFTLDKQRNWAFFPLYPLILRGAEKVTGGYLMTGVALSAGFLFAALVMLYKTAREFGLDDSAADRAVFYTAAFPLSYLFTHPQTESLFLLLVLCSFYGAKRERWWQAGVAGALATATRLNGVLLLPALLLLYYQRYGWRWRPTVLNLLLVPVGALAFMVFLYFITGDALACVKAQAAWGRNFGFFLSPLFEYVASPRLIADVYEFRLLNFVSAMLAFICGAVLLKRREWALGIYTLSNVIMPLSTSTLLSVDRFTMVIFPIFFVLARAGRRPRVDQTLRVVLIALLSLMSALFAAHTPFVSW